MVSDSVLIDPPYRADNVRGPKDRLPAVVQIKKVLDGYYQKKRGTPPPLPQQMPQMPLAKPAPAVPVPQRKGG